MMATNTVGVGVSRMLIDIDGSKGEGGGQVLRNLISYANILGKEIHVFNIRAGRAKPGLKAQHVTSLQLASSVCGGTVTGDKMNSSEIYYLPSLTLSEAAQEEPRVFKGEINTAGDKMNLPSITRSKAAPEDPRVFKGEIGTAGSIILLLQAALPCALLGPPGLPSRLLLKGGTNASMAPQYAGIIEGKFSSAYDFDWDGIVEACKEKLLEPNLMLELNLDLIMNKALSGANLDDEETVIQAILSE